MAREQLAEARRLSPQKQQIIFEQAFLELQAGQTEAGVAFFKEAFELEPDYQQARSYYIAGLLLSNQIEEAEALLETDQQWTTLARTELAISAARQVGAYSILIRVAEIRRDERPDDLQRWVGLAAVHYEAGDTETAISVLEEALATFPEFAVQGNQFIEDIRAGRQPGAPQVTVEAQGGEVIEVTSQ